MDKWQINTGGCPVEKHTVVEVVLNDGARVIQPAENFIWATGTTGWMINTWRLDKTIPQVKALDVQVGGDHYTHLKIQPMEYSMANKLNACQHTAIKYVTRYKNKGGREDLEKAKHAIDLLIQHEYGDTTDAV